MTSAGEQPGRVLGVDLGRVRIGLAVSDALGRIARPLTTLHPRGRREALAAIAEVVDAEQVETVVVGLPLSMSGEEGPAGRHARDFATRLRGRVSGVRVELWDERLTTVEAERTMIRGGATRRRRRAEVDRLAATLILQGYLDALHAAEGGGAC